MTDWTEQSAIQTGWANTSGDSDLLYDHDLSYDTIQCLYESYSKVWDEPVAVQTGWQEN